MPYIAPPQLPEDDLPLPFKDVLDYYLNSQLLQHRAQVDKFDLSDFNGKPGRSVTVEFGAPRWQMERMSEAVIEHFKERGDDAEVLAATAKESINDFITKSRADGWTATRKQGDTTVNFSEAIADEKHPANPERYLDEKLVFEDDVGFASVNGRGITFNDKSILKSSLPNLVSWMKVAKDVEAQGVMEFHPVIELGTDDNAAIYPTRTLYIGGSILNDTMDEGIMKDILLHERGHYINGDHDNSLEKTKVYREIITPVNTLKEFMNNIIHGFEITNELISEDAQKDTELLGKATTELGSILKQVSSLADRIKKYEWYDELSPITVAADMDNETSLVHHLADEKPILFDGLNGALREMQINAEANPFQGNPMGKILRDVNMKKAFSDSISPEDDKAIKTVMDVYRHMSKAHEYLADIHAAQYSEKPEHLHKVFDRFVELGFGRSGGDTHPDNPERSANAKHFAERVKFQREQAAQEAKNGQSR